MRTSPWSWLHCHLVNAQIMACVYIYFPGETVEQTSGFDTPPSPTFLMNGLHSIFLHFPQDTAINFDRWYVLSLKQWSWAHLSLEIGFAHPPLCSLPFFSISPFLSVLLFSCCSLAVRTEGHAVNIPFRAALYSRAAKLTHCCHESDI